MDLTFNHVLIVMSIMLHVLSVLTMTDPFFRFGSCVVLSDLDILDVASSISPLS